MNFEEFTIDYYKEILKTAKEKFKFISYDTVDNYSKSERIVIWRHDIDYSVHRALRLAEIENNLGIRSIYFILLHSWGYNAMEEEIRDLLKTIISMGHSIGLHFDPTFYGILSEKELDSKAEFEKKILETILNVEVKFLSLHNPNPDIKNYDKYSLSELANIYPQYFRDTVGGMINTYGTFFREKMSYVSDSNGYWRFRHIKEVLSDNTIYHLQVLTHPEWWTKEPLSPRQRIKKAFWGRAERCMIKYDELMSKSGRLNIDE